MSASPPDAAAAAVEPPHAPVRPAASLAVRRRGRRLLRGRVRPLLVADALALVSAGAVAYAVAEVVAAPAVIAPGWTLAPLALAAVVTLLGSFALHGLYERQSREIAPQTFDEVTTLLHALLTASVLWLLVSQTLFRLAGYAVFTPMEAVLFVAAGLGVVAVARWATRAWVVPAVVQPRRTVIIGAGTTGRLVERKLAAHPEYGLEVVGFVDDDPRAAAVVLGTTAELTRIVDELDVDRVILAASHGEVSEALLERVRAVRRPDVHLSIVPTYFELFASNATLEELEGVPMVSLPPMRLSRSRRALKRTFDLVVAAAALVVLAPVLVVVAFLVKLDSAGPVLFRQGRSGRGGEPFQILKFRTMVDGAEDQRESLAGLNELSGPIFKIRCDPRVTRVGRVLRAWSLDELPQLWNVVRGEMSLVGPRPFVLHEARQITGWAGRRLETTPGITGLWQVLGRNDIPFDEMVKLDYVYVTNWSLWWDMKILFQTVPVVLARRGAS
jgi:exopolysaccharide biosynthesis polyprenyl glycosylphosphotransferase